MKTSTRITHGVVSIAATICLVGCASPAVPGSTSANPTGPATTLPPVVASPSPTPTSVPSATTPPSVPPKRPTPAAPPTPHTQTATIPAMLGALSKPFTLLHQGVKANGDTSAWTPTDWTLLTYGTSPALSALSHMRSSRVISVSRPEYGAGEGIAQFSDVASANRFLDQVAAAAKRLDKESGDRGASRHRVAASSVSGGDRTVSLRGWYEVRVDGKYRVVPGAELTRFTRVGDTVVFAWINAEYVGDTLNNPHANADTRDAIDHVLWQM